MAYRFGSSQMEAEDYVTGRRYPSFYQMDDDNIAFMNCLIRVDVSRRGWQRAVLRVLRSTQGVRSFKMDENGVVEVSGFMHPDVLLRRLAREGRYAEVRRYQFGQCSSNLYGPIGNGLPPRPHMRYSSSYVPMAYYTRRRSYATTDCENISCCSLM